MLCAKCSNCCFTCDIGTCKSCGATTSSGGFTLCDKCAKNANECAACHKPLDTKVDPLERRGGIVQVNANVHDVASEIQKQFPEMQVNILKSIKTVIVRCNEPEANVIKTLAGVKSVALDY